YAPPQMPYGQPVMVPVAVQPPKRSGCGIAAVIVLIVLLIVVCGASLIGGGIFVSQHNANVAATSVSDNATVTADNATATADEATYTTGLSPTPYPPYTES